MRFSKLAVIICFALLFSISAAAQDGQIAGGYADTDVADEGVVAAANFAIRKQGQKTGTKITKIRIANAKVQVVAGLNYEVCLDVTVKRPGRKAYRQFAKAVVYKNLRGEHWLSSWTILKNKSGC